LLAWLQWAVEQRGGGGHHVSGGKWWFSGEPEPEPPSELATVIQRLQLLHPASARGQNPSLMHHSDVWHLKADTSIRRDGERIAALWISLLDRYAIHGFVEWRCAGSWKNHKTGWDRGAVDQLAMLDRG